jgi:hypothetical protein
MSQRVPEAPDRRPNGRRSGSFPIRPNPFGPIPERPSLAAGILTSNEMSGYEGCTKEEGDTVCQFIQKRIAGAQEDQRFPRVIYTQHGGGTD